MIVELKNPKGKKINADFIKITSPKREADKYSIHLIMSDSVYDIDFFSSRELKVCVFVKNKSGAMQIYSKAIIYINSTDYFENFLKIHGDVAFSDDYYTYDQCFLDHLYKYWEVSADFFIDRSEFTITDDEYYLEALIFWSGVPDFIEIKKDYFLDGDKIRNKADLFIQIGEIFCGNRGYFGSNLDALNECLFFTFKKKGKARLEVQNEKLLIGIIGKDYFISLIEVLSKFLTVTPLVRG